MPSETSGYESGPAGVPSMLDLVRLSPRRLFPPGGRELYRQIALLTDVAPDDELLVVACGTGVTAAYFVREHGVTGSGVDFDPWQIERAEGRAREEDLADRLHFQQAPMDALPYRDEIFDVVIGELGLAARAHPEDVLAEIVRVAKPGARLALVQLVWKAPVDQQRRRVLSEHLGARPLMLVEWKRLLREHGVQDLHTEDWSDEDTAFRRTVTKPFPDFAELFSLGEKLSILRKAWSRWGWTGVRTAVAREVEVHRLLTKERILGLDLLLGRKGDVAPGADRDGGSAAEDEASGAPGPHVEAPDAGTVDDGTPDDGTPSDETPSDETPSDEIPDDAATDAPSPDDDSRGESETDVAEEHVDTIELPLWDSSR